MISVFSPLVSLLYGLSRNTTDIKRWALIVFITFYGSIIFLDEANDGYGHLMNVYVTYMDMSFAEFFETTWKIITFQRIDGTKGDLFIHVLSFIVGPLLKSPGLFFVFVSFIYGYFFSTSIFLIARHITKSNRSRLLLIVFALFVLWKNLEGINTVRTWTGLWVLFYGASHYFIFKKKRYLLITLLPPFIHFAYFLLAIPTWIVFIFQWVPSRVYFGIYMLSLGFSFNASKAVEYVETTELGASRRQYILDSSNSKMIEKREGISEKRKKSAWYLRLNEEGFHKIGFLIFVVALFALRLPSKYPSYEFKLLNIGMLNAAMANYLSFIFAVHSRSHIIGEVFMMAFLVLFLAKRINENNKLLSYKLFEKIVWLSLFFFFPFVVFKIAEVIYLISVFLVAFPFLIWLDSSINISIRELLNYIVPR